MTGPDDDMTAALVRTLHTRATEAPSMDGLTEKAVAIAARRRRRRIHASIAAIVVLVVAIPVAIVATVDKSTPAARQVENPDWRWESYQGAQVKVPPDWGYGVAGSSWCAGRSEGETWKMRPGAVGRPGPMVAILCPTEYPPVDKRENWLTLGSGKKAGARAIDHGWVEETRVVNGVSVTVFSNDGALRTTILDSAEPITGNDHDGCPSDHPVAHDPRGYRPTTGGLRPADEVRSISVCRYALAAATPLLSSGRVQGTAAQDVVAAIRSAPAGSGPNEVGAPTDSLGSEIVLLRVITQDGAREVVVRYSGAVGNGFDDGKTEHQLTAAAIRPLLTGANSPTQFTMAVAGLLGI
jgi:hypothetical protein